MAALLALGMEILRFAQNDDASLRMTMLRSE
jgi:hypothetical protein